MEENKTEKFTPSKTVELPSGTTTNITDQKSEKTKKSKKTKKNAREHKEKKCGHELKKKKKY